MPTLWKEDKQGGVRMEREKGFSNLLFRWELDRRLTRVVFCTVPDVRGRNIKRFGDSWKHFPRWVEMGYINELMRLTDFINSLPLPKRRLLSGLTSIDLMRPSQMLINDLWDVARERMPIAHFYRKYRREVVKRT